MSQVSEGNCHKLAVRLRSNVFVWLWNYFKLTQRRHEDEMWCLRFIQVPVQLTQLGVCSPAPSLLPHLWSHCETSGSVCSLFSLSVTQLGVCRVGSWIMQPYLLLLVVVLKCAVTPSCHEVKHLDPHVIYQQPKRQVRLNVCCVKSFLDSLHKEVAGLLIASLTWPISCGGYK